MQFLNYLKQNQQLRSFAASLLRCNILLLRSCDVIFKILPCANSGSCLESVAAGWKSELLEWKSCCGMELLLLVVFAKGVAHQSGKTTKQQQQQQQPTTKQQQLRKSAGQDSTKTQRRFFFFQKAAHFFQNVAQIFFKLNQI